MSNDFENNSDSSNALAPFVQFFEKQGWGFSREANNRLIHTGFSGKNGRWLCLAAAGSQDEHLIFLSLLPCKAPAPRRAACAELLSRINFGLTHGCFEMDFDDGEVRFRTSLAIFSGEMSADRVEHLVFCNLNAVDRFIGPIMKVIYADIPPKTALMKKPQMKGRASRFELN